MDLKKLLMQLGRVRRDLGGYATKEFSYRLDIFAVVGPNESLTDRGDDPSVIAEMQRRDSEYNDLSSGCSEMKTSCANLKGGGYALSSETKDKPQGEE